MNENKYYNIALIVSTVIAVTILAAATPVKESGTVPARNLAAVETYADTIPGGYHSR